MLLFPVSKPSSKTSFSNQAPRERRSRGQTESPRGKEPELKKKKNCDLFVISCVCLETDHYSLRGPVLLQSHSAFPCVRNSRKYSVHSQNLSLPPAHLLVCTLFLYRPHHLVWAFASQVSLSVMPFCYAV